MYTAGSLVEMLLENLASYQQADKKGFILCIDRGNIGLSEGTITDSGFLYRDTAEFK